jgi:fluoroquinolone transport system permease protein
MSAATRQRVTALLTTELRLLQRFSVFTAAGIVTILWVAILLVVPSATRAVVVPVVLLTDVTALGFLFVPTLLVMERIEGVEPAMRLTRVRTAERVGVRVGLTTTLSLAAGLIVTVAARAPSIPVALLGVATTSVLVGMIAFAAVGSSTTLTTFLLRAPLVAGPLLTPAIIDAIGLAHTPLLYLSPVTSALDMMRGHMTWSGFAWQLAWVVGAAVLVGRIARRPPSGDGADAAVRRRGSRTWLNHPGRYSGAAAVRSFARADRRGLVRDGLLIMLIASVPLVAAVGRIAGTAGVSWARERHGIDLASYLPIVWVVLLVAHTPLIFGSLTGLLLLEDRDARLLPIIATTRASVVTLLRYRLAGTAACTAGGLIIGLPIAGVVHPAGPVGLAAVVVASSAVSIVPALLMAAFASNRVQGVAVMKIFGLPLYLPIASWFVAGWLRALFAPIPSSWAMWALWSSTATTAVALAAGAVVVSALISVPLSRRFLRHATAGV